MKHKATAGFTIIEVSFFLAISGLMAVGLLASAGATINSHRYKDSVVSLQSQLQHEFSKVENIQNGRSGAESCNSNAKIVAGNSPRGTSNCVMLGRFVAIEGDKISSQPVVGVSTSATNDGLGDLAYLKSYTIRVDDSASAVMTEGRKWGNSITYPSGFGSITKGTTRNIYFLIVRSPNSGIVYSFSSSSDLRSAASGLGAMIMQGASGNYFGRTKQVMCVKEEGVVMTSPLGVMIEANIANPNGIQVTSNDTVPGQC